MFRIFISFYVLLLVAVFSYHFIQILVINNTAVGELLIIDRSNDYVGLFHLIEKLHKNLEPDEFNQVIASYPDHANLKLAILNSKQFNFSEQQMATLKRGDAVATEVEDDIIYYQLPDTNLVVRIGPILTYGPLENIENLYDGLFLLLLSLPIFLWVFIMNRKLMRLNKAATSLGKGDFSVRVSEQRKHRVANLNSTFNIMAERLERLVKGHKDLTNAIAHELRTPISRMLFQLDMLHQEKNDKEREKHAIDISEDLNELSDMVDELLTYARFDREHSLQDMKPHKLHNSLTKIIHARRYEGDIAIEYDTNWINNNYAQPEIPFEPKHLERAIGNLISNAQKYANSIIKLHVIQTEKNCSIYVDDDGPGIPKNEKCHIFEPFKRLDNSRTRSTGGYGLGLALVKQIAQLHNGDVCIDWAPIGGSRFIFSWPIGLPNTFDEIKEIQ